jgi:hypothetical protein
MLWREGRNITPELLAFNRCWTSLELFIPCLADGAEQGSQKLAPLPEFDICQIDQATIQPINSFGEECTMKRFFAALLLASTVLSPLSYAAPKEAATMPKVGDLAPDFKLQYFDGNDLKDVSLSQYRGKKQVVLAFYIFAFTGG